MSRIFLIGDTHAGMSPLNYQKWMSTLENYFWSFYIPLLEKEAKEGDICIHLGDLFDNRTQIPIDVLNSVQKILERIGSILPMHILVGNHDIFTKASNDINSVKMYKYIPNITIYEKTEYLEYNGLKLVMMPWVEKKKDQVELIKKFPDDYLFCHSDLNGCRMHLTSVAHRNNDKIDVEEFNNYRHVYSGHIHIHQIMKNFTFIGSIYEMDRNDLGNQKGVTIIDTKLNKDIFIPNMISPRFKKVSVLNESDLTKLELIDTSKDYIDLKVSNSLLVGSRKLRRKLESILEVGSFSEIEYLNDMADKVHEQKISTLIKEIDINNIKFNDYESLVKEYINNTVYESDEIREGVKQELERLLKLNKK